MRGKCAFYLVAAIVSMGSLPAHAQTTALSALTDADRVALQRGQSLADGACAFEVFKQIEAYGGAAAMRNFTVNVEDFPLRISNGSGTFVHVCENGVHTLLDNGTRTVLQRYDDGGRPTMMER